MRVPTVSKVNTRQQQNPRASQDGVAAVAGVSGKSAVGNSFQDCLKSHYHQRDAQKKARNHTPEYIIDDIDDALPEGPPPGTVPAVPEPKHIDVRS